MKKVIVLALVGMVAASGLGGCSAIQNRNLAVDSKMSQTVFLNAEKLSAGFPIYVRFANTSGYTGADFGALLRSKLVARGYRVTDEAKKAAFILQANLLYLGEEGKGMTAEGAILGGAGGAATGAAVADTSGALVGGGLGATLGALAGSMYSVDRLLGVVDIQIEERTPEGLRPVKSRIVTTAQQYEMDKAKVKAELADTLAAQVAGIF